MSYATWLAEFPKFHAEYTCLRKGQAIFNWLSINNPELAVDLTGGELDCSLDISKPDPYLFDELAKFMKNMTRFYSNYPNALMDIQTHFLCGEIR